MLLRCIALNRSILSASFTSRRFVQTLTDVYIGNLPQNFSEHQLKDLLEYRDVFSYVSASVVPYTEENNKFVHGIVRFQKHSAAISAINGLKGVRLAMFPVDVALMTKSSTLIGTLRNTKLDSDSLDTIIMKFVNLSEIDSVTYRKSNVGVGDLTCYVRAKSPALAHKVLNKLSTLNYHGQLFSFTFGSEHLNPFGVFVNNLPATTVYAAFTAQIRSLLADKEFGQTKVAMSSKENGTTKGYGYVYFATQDLAERAVAAINGSDFLGNTLYAALDNRNKSLSVVSMTLKGVNGANEDDIKKMCEEAIGCENSNNSSKSNILSVRIYPSRTGDLRVASRVHFETVEARNKCIEKLNNTEWRGHRLTAVDSQENNPAVAARKILVFPKLPLNMTQEDVKKTVEQFVGEDIVKYVSVSNFRENTLAFVHCATQEKANEVLAVMSRVEIQGIKQIVTRYDPNRKKQASSDASRL